MKLKVMGVMGACLILAACGSKKSDDPAVTAQATPAVPGAVVTGAAVPPAAVKPAPEGLPSRVAREAITTSGLACASVTKADRSAQDGTITASCSSGESYRVFTEEGKGTAVTPL